MSWRDAPTSADDSTVVDSVSFTTDIATPIDQLFTRMFNSGTPHAGRDEALSVPAVLRGRNILCSIATLPLKTRGLNRVPLDTPFLAQIDPNVPNVVTLSQTVEDLVFEAVSWWRVTDRFADGFPASAIHVDVSAVSLDPPPGFPVQTLPSGAQPGGVVWVNGKPVPGRDMIRFDSPNPGVLKAAGRSIKRAIVLEQAATMYANDPRMLDYFTPQDNADPATDDEVKEILDEWQRARRERATGYVPAALKYNTVDTMSPADLQLAELQKQATVDIANAMGLDAEDLQVSTTSRTYANSVDRRRDRINDVLSPYMGAITGRLSMNDVTKRGHKVEFVLDDYMRADPTTRWNTYAVGLQNQIVSVPEVREQEGLPVVPVEPAARQRPAKQEASAMSTEPAHARFSNDDSSTRVAFDIPAADAQFRVNREKRTISGLLVPWNKVARSGYAKWSFGKDSLTWAEESRVKLNREHNRRESVGVATRLQSTAAGLDGSFKVARGAQGDEVLSLAEDGVLDGFSIEVDFADDGTSWARDPDDEMVRMVKSGRLAAVAITASPAFDDARVSSVAASRKEPDMSTKPAEPNAPEAPVNGPDTTAAFTSAVEAFTTNAGAFTDAVKQLVEVQQRSGEGPAVVDPTRRTAQFEVTEEALYRFDGTKGKHDFSSDIISGAKGDYDAMKRAEQFLSENFAVNQAGVAGLNPERDRPDLYVDQLDFVTPLWDSIRKGTIPDNTPFVLPKFASSSGLVGDHTEGTEPTPGALSATSQTITPSPVSGKVEVTREAWDQGGSPQLSTILWRQMTRAYDEGLEQAAADMLDALTVTEIALGTVDDAALATDLKRALAALHFVRGGNRFRDFKLEQGLYEALAVAKDADGRPLFPILNPQNADGRTDAFFGAVSIGGLAGIPSWALPGTVAGTPNTPGNSYLYSREDVHGWASAPQRLNFEYRVAYVDVGIWGYKALAATRNDGVRRVTYDSLA